MEGATAHGQENFADRVALLVEKFGMAEFSRMIGVSDTTVRNWMSGTEPRRQHLNTIREKANVTFEWLIAGQGPMYQGEGAESGPASAPTDPAYADFSLIPKYQVDIAGGYGLEVRDEEVVHSLAFRKDWLSDRGIDPRHAALVTVRGRSQSGYIESGDLVLVDLRYNGYAGEGLYALRMNSDLMLKLVQRTPDGVLHILSKNPEFPTISVKPADQDQVHFVGCVVWKGSDIPHPALPPEESGGDLFDGWTPGATTRRQML